MTLDITLNTPLLDCLGYIDIRWTSIANAKA